MRSFCFYITLLFLWTVRSFSQEVLTGLQFNPSVISGIRETGLLKDGAAGGDTTPVSMPFFDDFSANAVFPSTQRWIDRYTFENTDYPVFPVNLGAITFDAINDSGCIYSNAVPGPTAFIADRLTSRYIRLDSVFTPIPRKLTPSDSVYLSFYYQPQGRGRPPQVWDSLILHFLVKPGFDSITPTDTITIPDQWQRIWFSKGMSLDTFYLINNKYFQQVMIPVTDPKFFTGKFRFQFFNYVSLASSAEPSWQVNTDQWSIDNIYLNFGRNRFDTILPEIRFIERPPSMLKNYESMPYQQYCNDPTNEIGDTINILISNRDLDSHMSSYNYYVTQPGTSFSKTYSGGSYNIRTFYYNGYVSYQPFAHPPVPFLFPIGSADSTVFLMKHIVKDNAPGSILGDTIQAYQKFYNYYAYDDGTPEASYGLSFKGSKLAYRFRLNQSPDTLRAIDMYFNRTLSNTSQQWFYLCVWNDNAGLPGDTIYSDLVMPEYTDSLNKFFTYHIDPPLKITGTFYIGWIQTTNDNLCIGFDRYNNRQQEIFFNTWGQWSQSAFQGSLLMRPIVGKPIPLGTVEIPANMSKLMLFPNPASGDRINIVLEEGGDRGNTENRLTTTIYNLFGQPVRSLAFSETVDISGLSGGMYLLVVSDRTGLRTGMIKFIIAR